MIMMPIPRSLDFCLLSALEPLGGTEGSSQIHSWIVRKIGAKNTKAERNALRKPTP
jgi:hypothetical protein